MRTSHANPCSKGICILQIRCCIKLRFLLKKRSGLCMISNTPPRLKVKPIGPVKNRSQFIIHQNGKNRRYLML